MADTPWHATGVQTVAPGLHRLPLPLPDDGLRAVNAYLIEDNGAVVLVDPGQVSRETTETLTAGLRELGYGFDDVSRCLATHVHRDHYTNAIALRRERQVPVLLGGHEKGSLDLLGETGRGPIHTQLQVLPECGAEFLVDALTHDRDGREPPDSIWEAPSEWLADGDIVHLESRALEVTWTPGHTRGHVTYRDAASGLLLTGDHVLPHITPSIGFEPAPGPLPLADFLASLHTLLAQPDATLVPAHGPVAASVHERVTALLAHHDTRLAHTAERVAAGAHSPVDVARGLRWTRRERELHELDPYNMMLAILETRAHLDVLTERGELTRETHHGLLSYGT